MSDERRLDFSVNMVYVKPHERVVQTQVELAKWRVAAIAGDPESQSQLARVYVTIWEEFKKRDRLDALIASNKFSTANAGWREAIDRYKPFYEAFELDSVRDQILFWLQAAAEQGHLNAQHALGTFYLMEVPTSEGHEANGRYWLSHAAEAGHAEAAFDLYFHLRPASEELETDPEVGIEWLEKAALLGHIEAAKHLATPDFDEDWTSPRNVLRAYIWTSFLDATQPANSPHKGWPFELKSRLAPEELRTAERQIAVLLQRWVDASPQRHQ